jgi:hypothetical protein
LRNTKRRRRTNTRSLRRRCDHDIRHIYAARCRRLTAMQHSSGNQKAEEDAKKDTDVKVKEVHDLGSKSGSKVVDQLITAVTDAKPEPPRKD